MQVMLGAWNPSRVHGVRRVPVRLTGDGYGTSVRLPDCPTNVSYDKRVMCHESLAHKTPSCTSNTKYYRASSRDRSLDQGSALIATSAAHRLDGRSTRARICDPGPIGVASAPMSAAL